MALYLGSQKVCPVVKSGTTPTGTLSITANGVYNVTNYASANVSVSGGGSVTLYAWVLNTSVIAYTVSELPSVGDNALVLDKDGAVFNEGLNEKTVIISVDGTRISVANPVLSFIRDSSYDFTL